MLDVGVYVCSHVYRWQHQLVAPLVPTQQAHSPPHPTPRPAPTLKLKPLRVEGPPKKKRSAMQVVRDMNLSPHGSIRPGGGSSRCGRTRQVHKKGG